MLVEATACQSWQVFWGHSVEDYTKDASDPELYDTIR